MNTHSMAPSLTGPDVVVDGSEPSTKSPHLGFRRRGVQQRALDLQDAAMAEARRVAGTDPAVDMQIVNARPVDALLDRAASARLVVVGTRGDRRLHAHGARRSIGEALALRVECPVIVIQDDETNVELRRPLGNGRYPICALRPA